MHSNVCSYSVNMKINEVIEFNLFCFNVLFVKVSRPSFIPFWGQITIEKHVPLSLVIDIIIEQGNMRPRICFSMNCFFGIECLYFSLS